MNVAGLSVSFLFPVEEETSSRLMKRSHLLGVVVWWFGVLVVMCTAELLPKGFSSSLIMPRRNHGCVVSQESDRQVAYLIGGRFAASVESLDMKTNSHRLVVPHHPLLDVNHMAVELVPSLANPSQQEIWVMCGFRGADFGEQKPMDHLVIIDTSNWKVRKGPSIDRPRGACTSHQFDGPISGDFNFATVPTRPPNDPSQVIKGRLVCLLGGLLGTHDEGHSSARFSCWDRLKRKWIQLPDLHSPLDHHNSVLVRRRTCPAQPRDAILVFNGRSGEYGESSPVIRQLTLGDAKWKTWPEHFHAPFSAAAVTLSPTGKMVSFGGIDYSAGREIKSVRTNEIHLFDVCSRRSCTARTTLAVQKWAIFPCQYDTSDHLTICGGDSLMGDANSNHPYCETFDLTAIEKECDGRWLAAEDQKRRS